MPVLEALDVRVSLLRAGGSARRRRTEVLHGVSLNVPAGVGTGLIGVSGAGKSTLLRTLLALETPDSGTVAFDGREVRPGSLRSLRWYRRAVQYVPQDPAGSLDPRMTVEQLLREPLVCLGVPGLPGRLIDDALGRVDLPVSLQSRRPSELSGGQNQRVAIARALVVSPTLLLADEPVSGLDAPLRQHVLDVLGALVDTREVGLLLVSHDLAAIAAVCVRTAVLDGGAVVEEGPTAELLSAPSHATTRQLTAARLTRGALLP